MTVAVLALFVAVASSVFAHPTYVGKSTLLPSGAGPQQGALMVLGYMTIFNDPATTTRLSAMTKIPEDVNFGGGAWTVAVRPILTIEATADDLKAA